MASSKELAEQLEIAQQLNAVISKMAGTLDRIEKSYESQTKLIDNMFDVISENAKNIGSSSSESNEQIKELIESFEGVEVASGVAGNTAMKMFDKLNSKTAMVTGAVWGFGSALKESFNSALSLGKASFSIFTSLTSAAFSIGKAILSIPIRVFSELTEFSRKAVEELIPYLEQVERVRAAFGNLAEGTSKSIMKMDKSLSSFSAGGLSSVQVFGELEKSLEAVQQLATALGPKFDMLKSSFEKNTGAIMFYQKGLGLTDDQMKALADRSIQTGEDISDSLNSIAKQSLSLGKAFGISQKVIAKEMGAAIANVSAFGHMSKQQIGAAVVYAHKLGIELKDITGLFDSFGTFDTAADNVSKLSQAFGVTLDTFALVKEQDPAKQLDMLKKSFSAAGQDASKFDKVQIKLLAGATGLSEEVLRTSLSFNNQGVAMSEVSKKSQEAEKKQLSQAEAMSQLASSIERIVKIGSKISGFFNNFIAGIKEGVARSGPFRDMITQVGEAFRAVFLSGKELGKFIGEKLGPVFRDMTKFLNPSGITSFFGKITAGFKQISKDQELVKDGKLLPKDALTVDKLFMSMKEDAKKLIIDMGKAFGELLRNVITKYVIPNIPNVATVISKMLDEVTKVLSNPKGISAAFGEMGKTAGGELSKNFKVGGELMAALTKAMKQIWDSLRPLLEVLLGKILTFLGEMLEKHKDKLQKIGIILIGSFFTRVVLQTVLGALLPKIVSTLSSSLMGGLSAIGKAAERGSAAIATKLATSGAPKLAGALGVLTKAVPWVAAGFAVGQGVQKYTNVITSTLNQSEKKIAAGATGLIDGLTLGLLPDGWMESIANAMGTVTSGLFSAIESVFGEGLTKSIKDLLADSFATLGSITDIVIGLFTGDTDLIMSSLADIGVTVLKAAVSALDGVVQAVSFLLKGVVGTLRAGFNVLLTSLEVPLKLLSELPVVGGLFGLGAEGIAAVKSGMNKSADFMQEGIAALTKTMSSGTEEMRKSIDASAEYLKGSNDKLDAEKARATSVPPAKASVNEMIDVKKSKIEEAEQMVTLSETLNERLSKSAADSMKLSQNIIPFFDDMKSRLIKPIASSVEEILKLTSQVDDALADAGSNTLDVHTRLKTLTSKAGLGSSGTYTIKNKGVQINANFTVVMAADDIERAIVQRENSKLRATLNHIMSDGTDVEGPITKEKFDAPIPRPV